MFAIGIHIIVLVLSGFFVSSDVKRNLIDVQFGTSLENAGDLSGSAQEKKSLAPKKSKGEKSISLGENASSVSESSGVIGVEGGSGKGDANAEATFGFSESVAGFKDPVYPRLAIKRGLEGEVKIKLNISAEGILLDTILLKGSGHKILDQAAMEAAKNWRFQKRSHPYSVEKNILFKLRG